MPETATREPVPHPVPEDLSQTASPALLDRAREGCATAYDELFTRAAERVQLFVRVRLGPKLREEVDSLDVLQETYAAALPALPGFRYQGAGAFTRWLCQIAENQIRGLADRYGAQKRTPPGAPLPVSAILERAAVSTAGPRTHAERAEARERLAVALEALDPEPREAVLLRFFQAKTIDEIAAETGASATAVRRRLAKALLRLGDQLHARELQP